VADLDPLEQELVGRARALGAELEFHELPGEWVEAAFMKDGKEIRGARGGDRQSALEALRMDLDLDAKERRP
jgi:hypothetical protein